jgi:hypothetical protein
MTVPADPVVAEPPDRRRSAAAADSQRDEVSDAFS